MKLNLFYRWSSFFVVGIFLGCILIYIGEKIKFTHINLVSFGGESWAVWFYPLALSIGFAISSKLNKIGKSVKIFFISLVLLLILFYILTSGLLFNNLVPFGIK